MKPGDVYRSRRYKDLVVVLTRRHERGDDWEALRVQVYPGGTVTHLVTLVTDEQLIARYVRLEPSTPPTKLPKTCLICGRVLDEHTATQCGT